MNHDLPGIAGDSDGSDASDAAAAAAPPGPRCLDRPRRQPRGPLRIFVILAGAAGLWNVTDFDSATVAEDAAALRIGPEAKLVGIVLARAWHFRTLGDDVDPDTAVLHRLATGALKSNVPPLGFIDYPIEAAAALDQWVSRPLGPAREVLIGCMDMAVRVATPHGVALDPDTLGAVLHRWQESGALPASAVFLAPVLALLAVRARHSILHSVALSQKVNRKRLLVPGEPSAKRCKGARPRGPRRGAAARHRKQLDGQLDASLVIDWIAATRDIKSLRKIRRTTAAYSKLFARSARIQSAQLLAGLRQLGPELIRKSRVRLDAVAMLLAREAFEKTCDNHDGLPYLYLYADASPQERGLEMFGASWDIVSAEGIERRLFPLVRLDREQLTASGKMAALLWQCFLVSGKNWALFKTYLGRVRSLTTDMGVERLLIDQPNCVSHWLSTAFPKVVFPPWIGGSAFAFPKAMHIPGWRHCFDGLTRWGLWTLPWFPGFLEKLKSLVSFFRDSGHIDQLSRHLEQCGLDGLASAARGLRLTTIAEWRWASLGNVCRSIGGILDSLALRFDKSWCGKSRDTKRSGHVAHALSSELWQEQFRLVTWLCTWADRILTWVGGCDCHEAELQQGQDVACLRKGRRLGSAFTFASQSLRDGLAEGNAWTIADFNGDEALWQQGQGAVRAMYEMGLRRIDFLNGLPYILARLKQPGIAAKCVELWGSVPAADHHRVSVEFLSPDGALRHMVDEINPDGSGVHPDLEKEIDSLLACPMDDSIGEGPHAQIKRIKKAASAACWSWQAATARLDQNLQDLAAALESQADLDKQALWDNYTSVIRPPGSHACFVPRRMRRKRFESMLYSVQHCLGFDAAREDPDSEDDAAVAGGGDDDDRGEPPDVKATHKSRMVAQHFSILFAPHMYVSVPLWQADGQEASTLAFFQVLSVGGKGHFVDVVGSDVVSKERGACMVSLQPLEIWTCQYRDLTTVSALPAQIELFHVEEPKRVDLLNVLSVGQDISMLEHIHRWAPCESDVEGCLDLKDPVLLQPTCDVMDPKTSVLSAALALQREGWRGAAHAIDHIDLEEKTMDFRRPTSKLYYFQVLLIIRELFNNGCDCIPSDQPQSYYQVLLKLKRPVPADKGDKYYKAALARGSAVREDGDQPVPKRRRMPVVLARVAARGVPAAGPDDGAAVGGPDLAGIAGDDSEHDAAAAVGGPGLADIAGDDDDSEQDAEPSVGAADAAPSPADMPAAEADIMPDDILGVRVKILQPNYEYGYHARLVVKCPNPEHKCSRSRSVQLQTDLYGPRAAEYFLAAWLSVAHDLTESQHRAFVPTADAIAEARDALR